MKVASTSVTIASVVNKLDLLAIEKAIAQLSFPSNLSGYEELTIAVIIRNDNVYPQEHYKTGKILCLSLQFEPEQILALDIPEVTKLVRDKTEAYLSTITEVEERAYEEMEDWF